MLKKLLLPLLGLLIIPQISLASPVPFSGWYASLGGGVANYNVNLQQNLSAIIEGSPPDTLISGAINTNNYSNNVYGSFAVGYDFQIKPQFVLGTELKTDLGASSIKNNYSVLLNLFDLAQSMTDSTIKYTNKYNFSLLFKPGYLANNSTMIYGVIGGGASSLEYSTSTSSDLMPGNTIDSASAQTTKVVPTLTLGFGVDKYITHNFSLGLEYNYLRYLSVPKLNQYHAFPSDGIDLSNDLQKVSLYRNTLELKLTYHF